MQAYATAVSSTDEKWEAHLAKFEADKSVLRKKGVELEQRHTDLKTRQAALADKHGGAKVKGSDKLKLNVGGTRVVARRETLCLFQTTRLAALFSGRWENRLLRDKKGRMFLDVNPTCFKKIVDFLSLVKIADPDDMPSLPEVAAEDQTTFDRLCDFFGLTEALAPPTPYVTLDSILVQNTAYSKALDGWLHEAEHGGERQLLYRASSDGWSGRQFHAKCDNQGPTLTIIKCTGGYIFGGFLDASWASNNQPIASAGKAFLFTLNNPVGLAPTKMRVTHASQAGAGHNNYGPCFGTNYDMYVADSANSNSDSYTNVGSAYQLPHGQVANSFLTGAYNYQAAEVEVFRVSQSYGVHVAREPQPENPAPQAEWETMGFTGYTKEIEEALLQEQHALMKADAELLVLEENFGTEETFIEFFASGETKDIVDLDANGEKMSVKRSTLMLCEESALARKFDDAVWNQDDGDDSDDSDDSEGDSVMIEQSAYCFGKIVNQLRLRAIMLPDEPLPPPPSVVEHEQKNFQRVVAYYFPGVEDFILTAPRMDSTIASSEQQAQLIEWLSDAPSDMKLLYRASRDGWSGRQFHAKCDNQGPTLTIIKCTGGYIFGGFLDASWVSNNQPIASAGKAFLFTLNNPVGLAPTKMPVTHASQAGGNNNIYGPCFGTNYDMCVADSANSNSNSYTNVGSAYQLPHGQVANSFLTGAYNYQAAEVEVFRVVEKTIDSVW
eukprot:SAG31_NODE_3637_length_4035_cov_1.699695_2_plen_723_part_00